VEETDDLESRLMINELVRVRLPNEANPGNYYSRIEDAVKKMLIISWPTDNGVLLPIRPDQTLDFSMVKKGSAYFFNGLVDTVAREPLPSATIIISSAVKRVQRRQDYRVKCLIPVEIIATLSGTPGGLHPARLHLKTNTYDLSVSGISLRCATAIPKGTLPVIKLSMPDGGHPIKSLCRVTHCFTAPDSQNKYHVGIQFIKLAEHEKARLARFVYRMQARRVT
jgi:c-di-GMP-binding flagellar brake protein YcgR